MRSAVKWITDIYMRYQGQRLWITNGSQPQKWTVRLARVNLLLWLPSCTISCRMGHAAPTCW
jgi:hypothetical protein